MHLILTLSSAHVKFDVWTGPQKAKCNEKKTSVKRFADSAYSICFLYLFEFRLVHPKIKFSSTCFGEYKI